MAWIEKTIVNVSDPEPDEEEIETSEQRLRDMFRSMPPFIKISSRRAREALVKYEAFKQRYIENLRNNAVYKFVMQVAAFTNEDMEKYWRGRTLAPFMEEHTPDDIKIEKEDVELLVSRAREHAFADLHQFCRPIEAIPMYRPSVIFPRKKEIEFTYLSKEDFRQRFTVKTGGRGTLKVISRDSDVLSGSERPEVTLFDYTFEIDQLDPQGLIPSYKLPMHIAEYYLGVDGKIYIRLQGYKRENPSPDDPDATGEYIDEYIIIDKSEVDITEPKYIYNMGDSEFLQFYKKFLSEKSVYDEEDVFDRVMGKNRIGRYILGTTSDGKKTKIFPAHVFPGHRVYEKDIKNATISILEAFEKIKAAKQREEKRILEEMFQKGTKATIKQILDERKRLRQEMKELKQRIKETEDLNDVDMDNVGLNGQLVELYRNYSDKYTEWMNILNSLPRKLSEEDSSDEISTDSENEFAAGGGETKTNTKVVKYPDVDKTGSLTKRKREGGGAGRVSQLPRNINNTTVAEATAREAKIRADVDEGDATGSPVGDPSGTFGRRPQVKAQVPPIPRRRAEPPFPSSQPMDVDTETTILQLKKMLDDSGSGVYDHTAIYRNGKRRRDDEEDVPNEYDIYDHPEYNSLEIAPNHKLGVWDRNVPVVRWEDKRPEFWFQRYVARWLAEDTESANPDYDDSQEHFQARFRRLFNNLRYVRKKRGLPGKWIRDLTGLRLTRMLRGSAEKKSKYKESETVRRTYGDDDDEGEGGGQQTRTMADIMASKSGNNTKTNYKEHFAVHPAEEYEGQSSSSRPGEVPSEVPLDFVEPLFNERFAFWKHNLVLGEYEKRSQYQADLWLQKTPWAIGKLYLMPAIVGHMMEAHVAITTKFPGYNNVELMDLLDSERHSFFFSKLVAMCIRTSAVLSGKKYGLDKAYMRLNLEKRRLMFSLSKLGVPKKSRSGRTVEYKSSSVTRGKRRAFEDARARGDTAMQRRILQGNY